MYFGCDGVLYVDLGDYVFDFDCVCIGCVVFGVWYDGGEYGGDGVVGIFFVVGVFDDVVVF